jgi:carbonic anhydrase/acetyltransferase-like protein (isoleucine patch superfamily)
MTLTERLAHHLGQAPRIDPTAFVHPQAVVIGNVQLGAQCSVWPTAVLRGDINSISIGPGTNLQDGVIVHLADDYAVQVGSYVTVGHRATLHACTVEDECLIGMGATVLDGAVIGAQSIVGAHALVPQGMIVPPGSMVMGLPGKVVRPLTEKERLGLRAWAEKYIVVAAAHREKLKQN